MKILIADDELLVRISVLKALNDLGIENCNIYQADCGSTMLQILKETPIDIAFVDIKMPDISGLEAITQALTFAPVTSFYILTGYSTFEYAAQAIRLGIKDYLLKPLDSQSLANIFQKEQAYLQKKNNYIRETYAAKIKSILLNEQFIDDVSDLFCLTCFCCFTGDTYPHLDILYQLETLYTSIKTVIIPKHDGVYIAFCSPSPQYSGTVLSDLRNLLEQSLNLRENNHLTIFYHDSFVPFSEIKESFIQLKTYSVIRITHGLHKLYGYHKTVEDKHQTSRQLAELFESFHKNYSMGLYLESSEIARKILADMEHSNTYESKLQLQHINQYLTAAFSVPSPSLHTASDFSDFFDKLLCSLLNQTKSEELDIKRVLTYIQQHYMDDISINTLTAEFHVSPNYFSSWFKKETNVRFTDYITNLRITYATQLLAETNLTIREISLSVGYFTASHFIRTFVKNKGITPAEYRKQILKK